MTDQPANYLPYHSTGYFSKIVTDYLSYAAPLQGFYLHTPDISGIKDAVAARRAFDTPRQLLVDSLTQQYAGMAAGEKVTANIQSLAHQHTFTVTTAHQPNIFTGPLYFIYKVLHVIRLADELNEQLPGHHFVPVYYMGSEDADLDELGYLNIGGRKLVWQTSQKGAVGRMKVDKALTGLIREIYGQTGVLPYGNELNELFVRCYTEGKTIQQATLELVNALFGAYGLVVLVPDNAGLKKAFSPVVKKELTEGFSHKTVSETIARLPKEYKVQAGGREINLFYLLNDKRERIERINGKYEVKTLGLSFTEAEILQELESYPDRFSANVILRGAFQETVLPNVAFVGGGGELAYWLELKDVFSGAKIPYPVLMLRNSFLLMTKEQSEKIGKLGFSLTDMFRDEQFLLNKLVKKETRHQLSLAEEINQAHTFYAQLKKIAEAVDKSLVEHVASLETKAVKKITGLEKKLLRAEKQMFDSEQQQIAKLKTALFPNNSLQERIDNFSLYYAREGRAWLQKIYDHSGGFNKGFGVIG
ncbi:bacillithiol biosynthesis cysteine-adding enzyme BshC [Sediminibacterium soli]|uniref:bacillithiol biosynthesis cysteine-adding enzyme BshC n=1 Tax=Sediminibacterium soli TaxID=2698829 RepID=UPI00137A010A|nr:bacillithiol biosynthesis cysteine-adding enzyme BshC [Sediminibacterium soli]NCI46641.1 bacillithiol biosynthesis cysteine-adding enzyme BshC [Sediminibacterium soli]